MNAALNPGVTAPCLPPLREGMALAPLLRALGLSQRTLARQSGLSQTTVSRVARGLWPARGAAEVRQRVERVLRSTAAAAPAAPAPKEVGPGVLAHTEAAPAPWAHANPEQEDSMLLQHAALTQQAREHFGLPRNPFLDDVQTPEDVYQTPAIRYVRRALLDCALHHGFMAVVGESGAGKSTLARDLEERIFAEGRDIAVIRPFVLAMEENDSKGKTLKSSQIAEAVMRALDPTATVRSSPEARFAQVEAALKASARAGRRHLLLIEEAHCMPVATLKHLKRWVELTERMRRLIGVALIAQPELKERFAHAGPELREVAQRCELVELPPLDNEVEGYLRHKFARFDLAYEKVFAPDAADAIRARLVHVPRGGNPARDARSTCYPLVVNNLVSRAMNEAARVGYPVVDAQVIAGC
ncbi:AAA family ATPase [Tibeticola sp.]|uniref:AAA family ATPase n=1 Tax=Tibeticola sp. TaxID=2005368 RepID=UPI0025E0476E|nr:AAA family ATPase [Tibeticola sp.]